LRGRAWYGDHPYGRSVGGTAASVAALTAPQLRAFYSAWYRPERTVLVVVGDIDPARVKARIEARFADWRGGGGSGVDPAPAKLPSRDRMWTAREVPNATSALSLAWISPPYAIPHTREEYEREQVVGVATGAFNRRLQDIVGAHGRPTLAASLV